MVSLLWKLATVPRFAALFRILPLPFWCYMIPMMGTTLGWLPDKSPLYTFLSQQLLPICLVLLLIGTDLKSLVRLGPSAAGLMLAGSFGTIAGGLISFLIYRRWLPAESWGAIGALTGSWIGGSANLLAVKEALHLSDSLMAPIILVDALVAYSWMALLVWASGLQEKWDLFVPAPATCHMGKPGPGPSSIPPSGVDDRDFSLNFQPSNQKTLPPHQRMTYLAAGIIGSILLSILAQRFSLWTSTHSWFIPFGQAFSPSTITVLLVTTVSLFLSATPLCHIEQAGLSRIGNFALFVLLTSIGARANFKAIMESPLFLALGLTWISIHGIIILFAGYLFRAPLGLIATASQANIGGTISAPLVGATYHRHLAGIGLLMAVLGNILGTYLGLLTGFFARFLVGR